MNASIRAASRQNDCRFRDNTYARNMAMQDAPLTIRQRVLMVLGICGDMGSDVAYWSSEGSTVRMRTGYNGMPVNGERDFDEFVRWQGWDMDSGDRLVIGFSGWDSLDNTWTVHIDITVHGEQLSAVAHDANDIEAVAFAQNINQFFAWYDDALAAQRRAGA